MKNSKSSGNQKIRQFLKNKVVLVTGGAGSIGSALVLELLKYPIKQLRVFDIDEHALFKLKRATNDNRLRLLLGNICDYDRIQMAGIGSDIIIHTAAIKNIEISEFNALDTVEVNVNGTTNMIKMALLVKPKIFINISTDKAADSSTLYGTTKNLGEKLIGWAATHFVPIKFGTVRFGNVIESRGNVFEVWNEELKNKKPLSITDPEMNRYFFPVKDAVQLILNSFFIINKGEIIVPKMKMYNMGELAKQKSKKIKIIGKRKGEKMIEILLTDEEKKNCIEKKDMWIINQSKSNS